MTEAIPPVGVTTGRGEGLGGPARIRRNPGRRRTTAAETDIAPQGKLAIAEGPVRNPAFDRRLRQCRNLRISRKSGAGGIRTPVPKQSACRLYARSRRLILVSRRRRRRRSGIHGMRRSRPAPACQPCGTSPMFFGTRPYGTSGGFRAAKIRPRERTACWQLLLCILFAWRGCSTARHDRPSLSGRYQSAP